MNKPQQLATLAIFSCTLTLQGFGLHPDVKLCCASKVNPRKNETALKEEKKKYLKQTESTDDESGTD